MLFKNDDFPEFKLLDDKCFQLERWGRDEEIIRETGEDLRDNFLSKVSEFRVIESDSCFALYVR
ncbi:MAG: hypothetical protein ACLFVB_10675 [Thermoplasmata archaeon]